MTQSLFGDEPSTGQAYRVLARKYRPRTFADLIGQDVLVRTLTNAFASGRIAHAFLLTGIRGIGKTTTARIIARGLNCIGEDGTGGPTISPCGVCSNCQMIADDRHMDVFEMDAASRTGVGDIRELIDTVNYLPTSARYKVYIIDEVHMLSNNAFNALLKTLEEPPAHVKFVFATTEIRKIPVTILSRCQRFDLKRVDIETLAAHLRQVVGKESVSAEDEALKIIAGAAEGSVRDSLSLLDQAIAHSADGSGTINVTSDTVRQMLGMGDKSRIFVLLEQLLEGKTAESIETMGQLYAAGADPSLVLQDLLEICHFISRTKLTKDTLADIEYSQTDRNKALEMADKLPISTLGRTWQMLLKGLSEARTAPNPLQAIEMILIRIAYAATLPSPAEIIKTLQSPGAIQNAPATTTSPTRPAGTASGNGGYSSTNAIGNLALTQGTSPQPTAPVLTLAVSNPAASPESYEEVVALFQKQREAMLMNYLKNECSLVHFEQGRIDINPSARVPQDFTARTSKLLSQWTGQRWVVVATDRPGQSTLGEQEKERYRKQLSDAAALPEVKAILDHFPGAEITGVKQTSQE